MSTQAPVEQAEMWSNSYPFPKDRYVLRLLTPEFKQSSKGNPMIEIDWEIVGAGPNGSKTTARVLVDAVNKIRKEMTVVGLHVTTWVTLTDANAANVRKWHALMKLPITEPNPESPDMSVYAGIIANVIVGSREYKELTDELDPVTGQRIPIMGDDGKPLVKYALNAGDFISRNTTFVPTNPY